MVSDEEFARMESAANATWQRLKDKWDDRIALLLTFEMTANCMKDPNDFKSAFIGLCISALGAKLIFENLQAEGMKDKPS